MRTIYIGIETPLFSASNLFSFTLYLSGYKYVVIFILHLLDICLGQMWWHICLNFSFFCLLTNVISDLSNICLLAKYSQIHNFIQWSKKLTHFAVIPRVCSSRIWGLTREFNGQTTTTTALLGLGNLLKNNSGQRSGRQWNMIDFPWQVDVGMMAKTSSGFRISNKASFCGSDIGSMSGKRFWRTNDKISSKILLEIKPIDYHDRRSLQHHWIVL